jgi:hypothetical protein
MFLITKVLQIIFGINYNSQRYTSQMYSMFQSQISLYLLYIQLNVMAIYHYNIITLIYNGASKINTSSYKEHSF